VLGEVQRLLDKGLNWLNSSDVNLEPAGREWAAIVEALSHLTPPQKGVVEEVELGGRLIAKPGCTVRLTREESERVGHARKLLARNRPIEVAHQGYVREFDKDALTFRLRDKPEEGGELLQVSFTPDQ
jgi:hypothetical protein